MEKLRILWHKFWIYYHNELRHYHFRKRDEHWDKYRGIDEVREVTEAESKDDPHNHWSSIPSHFLEHFQNKQD
ncbi:hypothetical protein D3C74_216210 [compost metagenome]